MWVSRENGPMVSSSSWASGKNPRAISSASAPRVVMTW